MKLSLNRKDLIEALDWLIFILREQGQNGEIRIVGGAALALSYFERELTQDIDVLNMRNGTNHAVLDAARTVADNLDLAEKWLNFDVSRVDALPTLGREAEWRTIYESAGIVIQVPSAEALLAMKLRASRPGRDVSDIRQLLTLSQVTEVADAAALYEAFYPGDALSDRALKILASLFSEGRLSSPAQPPPPTFPRASHPQNQ